MSWIVKAGNRTLADGTVSNSVINEPSIEGRALGDVVSAVGAAGIVVYDRTTKQHAVEFTIYTEHGSRSEALKWAMEARQTIEAKATLTLRNEEAAGYVQRWRAAQSHWESVKAEVQGCSTIVTWRVTCGVISYAAFAAPEDEVDVLSGGTLAGAFGPDAGIYYTGHIGDAGVPSEIRISAPPIADLIP